MWGKRSEPGQAEESYPLQHRRVEGLEEESYPLQHRRVEGLDYSYY